MSFIIIQDGSVSATTSGITLPLNQSPDKILYDQQLFKNFFDASDDFILSVDLKRYQTIEIITFFFYQINVQLMQCQDQIQVDEISNSSSIFQFDVQNFKMVILKDVILYDLVVDALNQTFNFENIHKNVVILSKHMAKELLFNQKMLSKFKGNAMVINEIVTRDPFYEVKYSIRQCQLPRYIIKLQVANFNNFPQIAQSNHSFKFKYEGKDSNKLFKIFEETIIFLLDEHKDYKIEKVLVNTQQLMKKVLSFTFSIGQKIASEGLEFDIRTYRFNKDKGYIQFHDVQSFERDFNIQIIDDLLEIQKIYVEFEYWQYRK